MNHPLKGVKVIELGQIIAGTYGGQVLSDLGAEVIKVETPNGDLGRIPSVAPINGESGLFLTFNRNKKSIVIDLKTDQGLKLFYDCLLYNLRAHETGRNLVCRLLLVKTTTPRH